MRTRAVLARISLLASLGVVASSALPVAPALAASTGPQSASYDLRASETSSAGSFQIAIGQPASFTAWVDSVGYTTQQKADSFGSIVQNVYGQNSTGDVYLELWYGWSPSCSTLGPGDPPTYDGCEHEISPPYTASTAANSWTVSTLEPAPAGTETLFYDFQLYGQSSPSASPQLLLQAAAGAIVLNTAPPTMAIDATNLTGTPYPTNAFAVPAGTELDIQTCITADNCQVGTLDESNFLSDNEYICTVPPSNYSGPPIEYLHGQATQILTAPDVQYTPPPGQDWTFKFFGFIAPSTTLLPNSAANGPYFCPPLSSSGQPLYMTSVDGQRLAVPTPVLEVTWQGPTFTPPSVSLTASLTQQTPGQPVTLDAAYSNPDGAGYLYICARSGTSWLQTTGNESLPYLAEDVLPLSNQEGSVTVSSPATTEGTAQFIAFLSNVAPGNFQNCPQTATVGTYGTSYAGDWSNYVNVAWAEAPTVSLTVMYGGQTWTDQGPTTLANAYETVGLQGSASNLVTPPTGGSYYLYLCSPTPRSSSSPSLTGPWPYADPGTEVYPPSGTDLGAAVGANTTAGFVAFLSTDANYPADTGNTCPTSPSGSPGLPGDVEAVSPVVDVTWQSPSQPTGLAFPD